MSTMHKVLDAERLSQLAADPVEHARNVDGVHPVIDFSAMAFDDPRITDLCRQKYREQLGHWPEPGEFNPQAAVWVMAWLSKPEAPTHPDLQDLPDRMLAPREIVRDDWGWLSHPDMPVCDESVSYAVLLAAFGIETEFVSLDVDNERLSEQYFDGDVRGVSDWEPTPPNGEGWMLLEIYDTEDGPVAMFGRRMKGARHG